MLTSPSIPSRPALRAAVGTAMRCGAAGALAGLVVGGVGGRLGMLLLRHTSPRAVRGVTTDDGFVIGRVTTATIGFLLAMTVLGAVAGLGYAAIRGALPHRLRLPLMTLLGATVGGGAIVRDDGVDFRVLEPAWLAIGLFVALPALGAATTVALAEGRPAPGRPPTGGPLRTTRIVVPAILLAACAVAAGALLRTATNLL